MYADVLSVDSNFAGGQRVKREKSVVNARKENRAVRRENWTRKVAKATISPVARVKSARTLASRVNYPARAFIKYFSSGRAAGGARRMPIKPAGRWHSSVSGG